MSLIILSMKYFFDVDGLKHILLHHGDKRSKVYRRLFQVLWYGNNVGKVTSSFNKTNAKKHINWPVKWTVGLI